jgi:hypothetical protein
MHACARAQVAADPAAEVHGALHGLLLRLQPDLEAGFKGKEGALATQEGDAIVQRFLAPAASDLRYHPDRYFSWDRAAREGALFWLPSSRLCPCMPNM